KQSENRRLSLKLLGLRYSATPAPQPHGWVGASPPNLRGATVLPAYVATTTGRPPLPEIREQRGTTARPRLHVASHFRGGVAPGKVGGTPYHDTFGAATVPAGAPRLLVIGLDGAWRPPMQYAAHVEFIDPHAEGARRHHDRGAVREKRAQHHAPGARGGASGERDGDRIAVQVAVSVELSVYGAKLIAPFHDAVGFVDG